MMDIDGELTDLRAHLVWPAEVDLAPRLAGALSSRRSPRARAVLVTAVAVVVLVLAVPSTRERVAALFGIGGISIERGTVIDPATEADLGAEVDIGALQVALPRELGTPTSAHRDPEGRLWVVYSPGEVDPVLLTVFDGVREPGLTKLLADPSIQAALVEVAGSPAYWISGEDHVLLFETPDGAIVEDRGRLSAPTLIWQRDGLTYRLEADISMDRAIAIAESTR